MANNSVAYRCVCGETIEVDSRSGGECHVCGRSYTANAVNASMSMTIGMPNDVTIEPADPADDEMLGRAIDHFTIIDRLGGGGMGTVYRALDESLQRYVAIKVIRRGGAVDGSTGGLELDRLLQEARAQARVSHPNVVHIYFISRDESLPYLAMELVPGQSLASRLGEEPPLTYAEVAHIGVQVASALREAAQFDIVHGDIKPANIMMHEGNAKLSDFGLAHRMSSRTADPTKIAGTPNYMAPEVCRGEPADTRSDQYSFGVMLFEMTFGRMPYSYGDKTLETRFQAHQFSPIEFPTPWPESVPDSFREILQRLLAKDPGDRYPSHDAVIEALDRNRPIEPVPAGRLVRGLAWGIDLAIMFVIQTAVLISLAVAERWVNLPNILITALGLVAPVVALLWQRAGGRSPGKRLLQMRVVDEYGLLPSSRRLAWRSVFQLLPAWTIPLTAQVSGNAFLPRGLAITVAILGFTALVLDALVGFFTLEMRSIHDRIFKTRVVLDIGR